MVDAAGSSLSPLDLSRRSRAYGAEVRCLLKVRSWGNFFVGVVTISVTEKNPFGPLDYFEPVLSLAHGGISESMAPSFVHLYF